MTYKKTLGSRLASLFLVLAMVLTMLPATGMKASAEIKAEEIITQVADPSTLHGYKDYFGLNGQLNTQNAGGVWLDKSVLTESAFAGITKDDEKGFLIALSTMAEGLTYLSTEDFKKKVCYYDLSSGQQPQWKYIGDKPCLIDFSTTWCGWCKKLHPILEQVAKQYEGKVYVYTLDAEKEPEVAALFGVRSYPTVVFCPMEGGPRIAQGYHELDYWQEAIKQILHIE